MNVNEIITEAYISDVLTEAGTTAILTEEASGYVVAKVTGYIRALYVEHLGEFTERDIIEYAVDYAQDIIADDLEIDVTEVSNIIELVAPLASNPGDIVIMGDKQGTEFYFPNPAHVRAVETYCALAGVRMTHVEGIRYIIWA